MRIRIEADTASTPHGEWLRGGDVAGCGCAGEIAEVIVDAIIERGIAGMIEHYIHDDTYATPMCLGHEIAHIRDCAHVAVHEGPVEGIIAMEGIVREFVILTACPAMHLFVGSRYPDGVDTQIVEIIKFLGQTFDVAAVEGGHVRAPGHLMSMVAFVVRSIAVIETVGQHEIYVGIFPGEILAARHLRCRHLDGIYLRGITAFHRIGDQILPGDEAAERVVGVRETVEQNVDGRIR